MDKLQNCVEEDTTIRVSVLLYFLILNFKFYLKISGFILLTLLLCAQVPDMLHEPVHYNLCGSKPTGHTLVLRVSVTAMQQICHLAHYQQ